MNNKNNLTDSSTYFLGLQKRLKLETLLRVAAAGTFIFAAILAYGVQFEPLDIKPGLLPLLLLFGGIGALAFANKIAGDHP